MNPTLSQSSIDGDPSAWLDRYGDVLFRYAVARVGNGAIAEDLLQETLLAAMGSADTFQGGSTEQTWLVGILRHKVSDHFRRLARERQLEREWGEDYAADDDQFNQRGRWSFVISPWKDPEKSLTDERFWDVFNCCLTHMPEGLRAAFVLREFEGMDSDTLIETLDLSTANNLWVILHRARRALRRCLQVDWFENDE